VIVYCERKEGGGGGGGGEIIVYNKFFGTNFMKQHVEYEYVELLTAIYVVDVSCH